MNAKKKKLGFILSILSILLIPALEVLFIIGFNSDYLIKFPIFVAIGTLVLALIILLVVSITMYTKNIKATNRKIKNWLKNVFYVLLGFYIAGCIGFLLLLYGPNEKFKTWLITTAMQTMHHQYFCKIFYDSDEISRIMSKNYVKESGESTDTSLIDKEAKDEYIDEYDKAILDVEEGTKYKIIQFEVDGQKAFLAAIYDPSMIQLRVTDSLGSKGEYVTTMAQKTNAILAINGGGFFDPGGSSWGGTPNGITISNGKLITNGEYGTSTGGLIGFNDDDILLLIKDVSAQQALDMGIRDAVTWGPFLIVNGKPSEVSGNGGWGYGARTAIGQRSDGIVLFLVIDSNASRTRGADMADLRDIMLKYHAINAANLDGGTSTVMALPRQVAINNYGADCHDFFSSYACAINDPIDSTGTHQTRYIADAWVVVDK